MKHCHKDINQNRGKDMRNKINKFIDFIMKHKFIFAGIIIAFIIILLIFLSKNSDKSTKKTTPEDETEVTEDVDLPATTSVSSPKIEDAKKTKASQTTKNADSATFYNQAKCYQINIPTEYEVYEGEDNIIYLRKNGSTTQIAIIYNDGTFSDGIAVYEQCSEKIYKMTGLCKDEDTGEIVEKAVKNYGTEYKFDKQVGEYNIKYETSEIWFRNTGESKNVVAESSVYYTVMPGSKKGIILVGTSFDETTKSVFSDMDQVLTSIKTYVPKAPALNLTTYQSSGNDEMSFSYPKDWELTTTSSGLVYIKAPEDSSNAYAGCIIEYFCDYDKTVVDDYAQFSSAIESDLLIPTFSQTVVSTDFQYNSTINKIDLQKQIKGKDCIYYEIKDTIYPYSDSVKNSLGILRADINSKRYCFKSSGYNCMLNFIGPDSDIVNEFFSTVLDSVQCN